MFKIKDGSTFDTNIPVYYIEEETELTDIPADAPTGTLVFCNGDEESKMYMKNSSGDFNELTIAPTFF